MKPVKKASEPERAGSRSYLLAGVAGVILAIAIICFVFFPPAPANAGDEGAGALYDKSVDLANAGKFEQALEAADQALALHACSDDRSDQCHGQRFRRRILIVSDIVGAQ